jgi:hypothetical protein
MGIRSYSGRTATRVVATLSVLALQISVPANAEERLEVVFDALSGFTPANQSKLDQAAELLLGVLSSEDFRRAILGFTYGGREQFSSNALSDNSGEVVERDLSNPRVYEALMESRQTYLDNTDRRIHLDLALYSPPWYKKWSVVGYTYPGKPRIYLNRNYFNSYTIAEIAANLAHEWTHKLGFDHDFDRTARRPYSVPYGVGCVVEKLGANRSPAACAQPIGSSSR